MAYPVNLHIERPEEDTDRGQLVWRIAIIVVAYWILNGVLGFVWLAVPIFAAVLIAQKGSEAYLEEAERGPVIWIRVLLGLYAYAALLTSKFPLEDSNEIDLDVATTGSPTVGETLLRIILAIPHAIVLSILGLIGFIVWLGAVFSLFTDGSYPEWAYNYFHGVLTWNARVYAYLASLVEEYPPFSFDVPDESISTAEPPLE